MNKYSDLELSILSCLLQKPELMKKIKLEDKYFVKHKKIWLFMKSFYKKFNNLDLTLMVTVTRNKYILLENIILILNKEPAPNLFEQYEQQLIDLYNQTKKDKLIIEKIYSLTNDLIVGLITTKEFKQQVNVIYDKINNLKEENL